VKEAVSIVKDLKTNPTKVKALAKEQYDCILAKWTYDTTKESWRSMFEAVIAASSRPLVLFIGDIGSTTDTTLCSINSNYEYIQISAPNFLAATLFKLLDKCVACITHPTYYQGVLRMFDTVQKQIKLGVLCCHKWETEIHSKHALSKHISYAVTDASFSNAFPNPSTISSAEDLSSWIATIGAKTPSFIHSLDLVDTKIPTPLCEIMGRHGSDKGHQDLTSCRHNYTTIYHRLFELRRQQLLRVFELGLGTTNPAFKANMGPAGKPGASLRGWAEYFPNATVFGADLDESILFEEDRIKTYPCDQTDPKRIAAMWGRDELREGFDIILDDGWHDLRANKCFFEHSINKLNPEGYYIIEDVNDPRMAEQVAEWATVYPWLSITYYKVPSTRNHYDNTLVIAHNTLMKPIAVEVNAVCYINLAKRTDRCKQIEAELDKAKVPLSIRHRIDATYNEKGFIGCVDSHIKTLELALEKGWEWTMVLEDDYTMRDPATFWKNVHTLLHRATPNVLLLSQWIKGDSSVSTIVPNIIRVRGSITTPGYVIHRAYLPTLLANFKESRDGYCKTENTCYHLDEHWVQLQKSGRWYGQEPDLGYQRAGYSDIQNRIVNYANHSIYKKSEQTIVPKKKLVCVLADTTWSIGRVHTNIADALKGEYEFIFHYDAAFSADKLKADLKRCDVFLTTPNLIDGIRRCFPEENLNKCLMIMHYHHKDGWASLRDSPLLFTCTYCTISEAVTRSFPAPVLWTPSGVNPAFFKHTLRSGTIKTLGWCGNLAWASKRVEWSYKIAEKAELAVSLAVRTPFADMPAWYKSIDVLLVTAGPEEHRETGPLPPFEAVLSGVLVIGTAVGNFQLLPGPKFSTIEEAAALLRDLKKSPDRVKALAKEQYEAVLKDWTITAVLPKWRIALEAAATKGRA
jgi:hypothetical protein